MKMNLSKTILLAAGLLAAAWPARSFAQTSHGKVVEGLGIKSSLLDKQVRFSVYFPPDYAASNRSYPVVYLLHGYTDNETAWIQFGEVHRIADEGIANGTIPPMLIVMPDGGVSFYINNHDGAVRFEDFFLQEFIPHIEKTFRTRTQPEFRGIAGLSMGGYGALVLALRHPDKFAGCAAFSSAILTDAEVVAERGERWARVYGPVYGGDAEGKDRLTTHWKEHSPIHIVQNAPPDAFKNVRLYLDCGDDDFLTKGNATFHIVLRDRKVPHEYRVRDGGHTWSYWRTGLPEGLKFLGAGFHR